MTCLLSITLDIPTREAFITILQDHRELPSGSHPFFFLTQSLLWEYVWEGGLEQPSVQDLIITPLGGIILGELTHRAALAMGKDGFNWYKIILTCILNPAFAINNGFRRPSYAGN